MRASNVFYIDWAHQQLTDLDRLAREHINDDDARLWQSWDVSAYAIAYMRTYRALCSACKDEGEPSPPEPPSWVYAWYQYDLDMEACP